MLVPLIYENEMIGKYKIIQMLGNGAFGSVYKVEGQDGSISALKCFIKSRFKEHGGKLGELVQNEVKALERIQSPYVVRLKESFEHDYRTQKLFCIVLEYCDGIQQCQEGGDLQQFLEKNWNQFTKEDAITFFQQLLHGMRELHTLRIIHRDIKLPNILVHGKRVKIADFGFCHILPPGQSKIQLNLGSLGTQAPEIINNELYGLKSDMFSIGVVFYLMLFGCYPFSTQGYEDFQRAVKHENPPTFKAKGRSIEPYLEQLLTKMLKEKPEERLDWPELFKSQLFKEKMSQLFQTSMLLEQSIINPIESYLFYQNVKVGGGLKHQSFLESTPQIRQMESTPQIRQIEASFREDPQAQINLLLMTFQQIHEVTYLQVRISLFPGLLLLKLIYEKQVKNNLGDANCTYNQLIVQFQTVSANQNSLIRYMKDNWIQEATSLNMSDKFDEIYQQALNQCITDLIKEVDTVCQQKQVTLQEIWSCENEQKQQLTTEILKKIKLILLLSHTQSYKTIDNQICEIMVKNDTTLLISEYFNMQNRYIQ